MEITLGTSARGGLTGTFEVATAQRAAAAASTPSN
jgi:hypothetical protein